MPIDFCTTHFLDAVVANGSEKKLLILSSILLMSGHFTQKDALTHFSIYPDSGKLSSISSFCNFDWYKVCYL